MYYDGWALTDLAGMFMSAPAASGIPADSMSQRNLTYTVSGAAGDGTLTISAGDESKGTGVWAAVIKHDDDTYGFYLVSALADGACTIFPNLRADVTAKDLRNIGGGVNGQHWTEPAYRALARSIYATTRDRAYKNRWAAQWLASDGAKADWTNINGLGPTQYSIASTNTFLASGPHFYGAVNRSRMQIGAAPTAPRTGKGLSKTFSGLDNVSGTLEIIASVTGADGYGSLRLVVEVNGTGIADQTYTPNDGLVRARIPVTGASSVTVKATNVDETGGNSAGPKIDSVTLWVYDRTPTTFAWSDPIIKKNGKIVVLGDSWTTFYPTVLGQPDGVLGRELQQAMHDDGGSGTVVSVGTGGTTAEYGLTEFEGKVAPENPDQVVILYFTNDHNQYGDAGYERWLSAMTKLGLKCQAIGAEAIFISPLPTSSFSQAIGHGVWANQLCRGRSL